jgi:TPR repeat protein
MKLSRTLVHLSFIGMATLGQSYGQELDQRIGAAIAERYEAEADQIYQLELSGDPASKLELARLLLRGTLTSPTNPLLRPDLDRAETLLDAVIESNNKELAQRALSMKADLLGRRGTAEALAERDHIRARLVTGGYAPAIADLVIAGAPLPAGLDEAAAIAALETRVLAADPKATEALARLLATSDPERSKSLAAQAIMMSMSASANSPKAATDLGKRYLDGIGIPADPSEGLRLLQEAAAQGSDTAIDLLDQGVRDGVVGLDTAAVREIIIAALTAGSSDAAEIIVSDLIKQPVYGFTRDDALTALRLLRETGDREALLRSVQFYAGGGEAAPDLEAAIPLIEQLVDTKGQPPAEIMRVALKLEAVGLPVQLALKYVEPMFRSIGGEGADEANYQADRILAAAAEAGIPAARSLPPERTSTIIAELRAAGERGHVRSLILLGDLYYAGIWVAPTYRQAMQYYQQAFDREPTLVAQERVAKALLQIKQSPFEEERFEALISGLASSGSDWGQYRYGLLLISGTSRRAPDIAAGEELLLSLASRGFAPAVRAMIDRLRGEQNSERMDRAIEVFTKAWALRKDYKTGRQLGEFYVLAGRPDDARAVLGHPMFARDPSVLLSLARMEAPANASRAYELAMAALTTSGDDQTTVELSQFLLTLDLPAARAIGEERLQQMADAGNTDAMGLLVASSFDRLASDPAVLEKVLDWTVRLARVGEVAPIIELAATYLAPRANPEIAREVLPVAEAALAVLPADSYVAVLVAQAYFNGWGTKPDADRGNALIEAAAAAGNSDALTELGLQYFYGMGRERSTETGIALLDSAAALGHGVARVELGRLSSSATGPNVDRVKAYSMFLDAAGQGSSAGMLEVGRLYLAGWGIGADEKRGVEWLERAASLGNFDAMYQLYFHYYSKPDAESQALARQWLDRSVDAGVNPARLRLAVHLLSTEGDAPGSNGYDDAVTLLDDAFAAGYNTARKFSQTSEFKLPTPGENKETVQ